MDLKLELAILQGLDTNERRTVGWVRSDMARRCIERDIFPLGDDLRQLMRAGTVKEEFGPGHDASLEDRRTRFFHLTEAGVVRRDMLATVK